MKYTLNYIRRLAVVSGLCLLVWGGDSKNNAHQGYEAKQSKTGSQQD